MSAIPPESHPDVSAPGVVSLASSYSVAATIQRLEDTARARGLTIFARIDHHGEAERAGLRMQEAQLIILGSLKGGTPLMVAAPLLALDLPFKALVWQDRDGHVWVSYNSTAYLADRYAIPDDLVKSIAWIDIFMQSVARPT
jgi:uncharacterized protein (DUF302 family)